MAQNKKPSWFCRRINHIKATSQKTPSILTSTQTLTAPETTSGIFSTHVHAPFCGKAQ